MLKIVLHIFRPSNIFSSCKTFNSILSLYSLDVNVLRFKCIDISKSFDRVWHQGPLFKLKAFGIQGKLLTLIKRFLSDRLQTVVLNGQTSSWKSIFSQNASVHLQNLRAASKNSR